MQKTKTLRGWNKCDDCGRYAKPEEMMFEESRRLYFGVLYEDYWQHHKEGYGCRSE